MKTIFNFSFKKVGGLRFIKIGRLTLSYSIAKSYRPIGVKANATGHLSNFTGQA